MNGAELGMRHSLGLDRSHPSALQPRDAADAHH